MSSARRNVKNLAINWLSFGATGVVMFFISPFVIHSLGTVEYGIWSLVTVLTGYMGVLDLGIRASTGRHIFLYTGRGDHDGVDETIRTSLGFFTLLGAGILVAATLLGGFFSSLFAVPADYHRLLLWLMPMMAANVWFSAVGAIFSSVLLSHERFDLARGVDLFSLLVRTLGTIIVLHLEYGIIGLALVVVGCNVLPVVCNALLAKMVYPSLRFWPLQLNPLRLKELGSYGVAAFVSTVAIKIVGQTDLFVVGATIDVAAVTVYSVGAMLVYYSQNLLAQIDATFQPALQKFVARDEMGSARWIFFRQTRLAILLGVPMYVGFIVYAESFIRLWMYGPEFGDASVRAAATVMAILAASKLLNLFYVGSGPLLAAMGHVRFNAILSVAQAIVNLALSLLFVLAFDCGLWGVALGTFVSRLFVMTFLLPWYACLKARIAWSDYLWQIGGRGLWAMVLFAGGSVLIQNLVPADSWTMFTISVLLSLVAFVPIALLLIIPKSDRDRIHERIRLLWA